MLYVGHHGWPKKEILGFRWSKKAKITLETNVFGETFPTVFSNFLHFNESLPMKSYQFFKIYIRFYKKWEKTLMQQSMGKEKKKKFGPCLNFMSFSSRDFFSTLPAHSQRNFCFWCQDDATNIKRGNWERQIARNSKLKNLFQK